MSGSYSRWAQRGDENAQLRVIPGSGHELFGAAFDDACEEIDQWLGEQGFYR